ncbi:hypothetical protein OIE66_40640 [Nonomuraea sp. NBC_01738]|uniref:hypothetical protein n=1 Tax=Nonomuraea sp. NBC_01738 TaxID=2976003 RepID=UPI002E0E0EFD|nr:hypothetical protein OIE66_40640 [Nonomuraea sp. NBC_01738]
MTIRGRYSGPPQLPRPRQQRDVTQVRIIGPAPAIEAVQHVLTLAETTLPGWEIVKTSRRQPAERPDHVRLYIDLRITEGSATSDE